MLLDSTKTPVQAAHLLPLILPILAITNGVIVPKASMIEPWRSFVYYVNPITWYVNGQFSTLLHNEPVICSDEDTFRFDAPRQQSRQFYAGAWAE